MRFRIIEVLKGEVKGRSLNLSGGLGYYLGRSLPEEGFDQARPGSQTGGCIAYDYSPGKDFLLFLNDGKPGWDSFAWRVYGYSFARVNEEVVGRDDLWLEAVRLYVKLAAIPDPNERLERVTQLRREAKGPLADDLSRYLGTITADKPVRMLASELKGPEAKARWAAQALGWSRSKEALPHLVHCIEWEGRVRSACIEAMGDLGFREAAGPLQDLFKRLSPGSPSRAEIAFALAQVGSTDSIPMILDAIASAVGKDPVWSFTQALLEFPEARNRQTARLLLHSANPDVRSSAASALGQRHVCGAQPWIEERLSIETDPRVKRVMTDSVKSLQTRSGTCAP